MAEAFPFFFIHFGLQVIVAGIAWRLVQTKIERDAKGSFGRTNQPARESILDRRIGVRGFDEIEMVSANADVCDRMGDRVSDAKLASPIHGFDQPLS